MDPGFYILSTGYVGRHDNDPRSKKVKIRHSSAIIEAILNRSIHWKRDPAFGYQIAAVLPSFDDPHLLDPRFLYKQQGCDAEYQQAVLKLKKER